MKTPSKADHKFVKESQRLSGFPGRVSKSVLSHKPNLQKIAQSAKTFGAQARGLRTTLAQRKLARKRGIKRIKNLASGKVKSLTEKQFRATLRRTLRHLVSGNHPAR